MKPFTHRNAKKLLLGLVALVFLYFVNGNQQQHPDPTPSNQLNSLYKVVNVVDGDTIDVELNGIKQRVRLLGIDTPESVDPRKPIECFGKEASSKTAEIVLNKSVKLESDETQSDKDKYKRLLRYVFLEDGTFVNELLIKEGYAHEYTYDAPYKYQAEFKLAQTQAQTNKKGLWADAVCQSGVNK